MTHADYDGHPTTEDIDSAPLRFFTFGNARIAVQDGNPWIARLQRIGADEVSGEQFKLADKTWVEGGEE